MDSSFGDCEMRNTLKSTDPLAQTDTTNTTIVQEEAETESQPKKKSKAQNSDAKERDVDPLYERKVEEIKRNLYRLYDEYAKDGTSSNVSSSHSQSQEQTSSSLGGTKVKKIVVPLYAARFEQQRSTQSIRGKSELDTYLEASQISQSDGFDVLAHWKDRSRAYHVLSRMARDVLSIPITTVASESAFSIGSRILNKYRSSLNDEIVQVLMCTRSWLHGFDEFNKDDDEEQVSINFEDVILYEGGVESVINV